MTQDEIFLRGEADAWYKRNAHKLSPGARRDNIAAKFLRRHRLTFKRVLEIGSTNGWRLEMMRKQKPRASYVGVEPSRAAVRAGRKMFPNITLLRGVASALPVKGAFNMVLVIFVLHWVSRGNLLASIAEIDRVTAEGGYLVVSDFLPRAPSKTKYAHLKRGVSTWKTDYGALFEATGNYRKIERLLFNYDTLKPADARTPERVRAVITLYQKKTGGGYTAAL